MEKVQVSYDTGVQQGDNMAPILFLFVMQAAMNSISLTDQPLEFRYFPDKANANVQPRRLITQPTKSQGDTFNVDNLLYVDDECFLFAIKDHLEKATQQLFNHFAKVGLQMHMGTKKNKKMEAMHFPMSLQEAEEQETDPTKFTINKGGEKNPLHIYLQILWSIHQHPTTQNQ